VLLQLVPSYENFFEEFSMSKLSTKSMGRVAFVTGSLLGVIVTAYSCGKSASKIGSRPQDNENAIVYTIMSRSAFEGRSPQSFANAKYKSGFREFAYRTSGLMRPNRSNGDQDIFLEIETNEIELQRTCNGESCTYSISKVKQALEPASGDSSSTQQSFSCDPIVVPSGKTELSLTCTDDKVLHLAYRRSLPIIASVPMRRPHTGFEFWRLGPVYSGDNQVLAFVHKDAPIVFAVEPVVIEKGLLPQLQLAADYWNRAIGYTAIRINPSASAAGAKFSPLHSTIRYFEEVSNTAASAGYYADPVTGQILSIKVDIRSIALTISKAELLTNLTHEFGHALGLAHNFAASSDPLTFDTPTGSSVMDYYVPDEMPQDLSSPLMYDQAAMDWIYRGTQPSRNYRHCTDIQSWYLVGCDKFDARIGFDKRLSEAAAILLDQLKSDQQYLKKIMDPIVKDGAWDEINRRKGRGDIAWTADFLLDLVTNGTFVSAAYKYSAFSPDPQTRAAVKKAWTDLLEAALRAPTDIYKPSQLEFLKLSLEMFQTEPVNPANLKAVMEQVKKSGL
jgi:hypothetical protein